MAGIRFSNARPRRPRGATGGDVYHALNRAVGRSTVFEKVGDYAALERVLEESREQVVPVQEDEPSFTACRYVERSALRADL